MNAFKGQLSERENIIDHRRRRRTADFQKSGIALSLTTAVSRTLDHVGVSANWLFNSNVGSLTVFSPRPAELDDSLSRSVFR